MTAGKSHSLLLRVLSPVLLLCTGLPGMASAPQTRTSIVSGLVVDANTGKPLELANVFLANTMAWGTSSTDGRFTLRGAPSGSRDLVISRVGYERMIRTLPLTPGDSLFLEIRLLPRTIVGEEVQVLAERPEEWQKSLAEFKKVFLGEGDNSEQCTLLNPEVLNFRDSENVLVAWTDSLIRLENRALGYRLQLALLGFTWDTHRDMGSFRVSPSFQELAPGSNEEQASWRENRRAAYQGSLRHFLWSLERKRARSEGFRLYTRSPQGRRGMEESEEIVSAWLTAQDDLFRWDYQGWVRVRHGRKESLLHLKSGYALVDSSGALVTPVPFETRGEWARGRVSAMLPAEVGFPEQSESPP